MNYSRKLSTSLQNSTGDVAPVEKLLNLVMNFPKTIVMRGNVALLGPTLQQILLANQSTC
jgi:hypothetical protein